MTFDIMLKVTKRINELLQTNDVGGIVITHGTDTDGPLNLYNAVAVAGNPKAEGRGVLVVMNAWIHAAHSLTKTSTTDVQTFMSPLRGLVGVVSPTVRAISIRDSTVEAHDDQRVRYLSGHEASAGRRFLRLCRHVARSD